ncbi:MAG: hypothetical protein ACOYVD_05290 [Bacillota bacterium]
MTKEAMLEQFKVKFAKYYDLKDQPEFVTFPIDFYAHFYQVNEKYFGVKSFNMWRMTHDEHCLVKYYEHISKDQIENMITVLKKGIDYLVKPDENHMKTFVTGVFIVNNLSDHTLIEYVEKFKYSKAYRFYLYGWCDVRLVLIDLSSRQIYTNKAGREVQNFYRHVMEDNMKNR